MLIRIASDLHLERFGADSVQALSSLLLPPDPRDRDAVLVLAGDISSRPDQLLEFLQVAEVRFRTLVFVPGNHEFYGHDYWTWLADMRQHLQRLQNTLCALGEVKTFELDETCFVVGTLWGDGGDSAASMRNVDEALNDFRLISFGEQRFTALDMAGLHATQRQQFEQALARPGVKVAVSHHLPSYELCHPRFGDALRGGFASRSEPLLSRFAPALWIHGHTHDSGDRMLGQTRVVCHPAGYRTEWGSPFNAFMAIERGVARGQAKFVEI